MTLIPKIPFPEKLIPHTWLQLFTTDMREKKLLTTLKAKADAERTFTERVADFITALSGSFTFLALNAAFFAAWILINTGILPIVKEFDPFPFSLLTTIVSLEAIILAIIVLVSQNRAGKIDDLREEVHLQINLIAEREITKLIQLHVKLLEKSGVDVSSDEELKQMLKPVMAEQLETKLKREIE
jgi:uncharacterized membrane protein